ncbi:TauD/TfdA dioxygenase family protein [Candidatus Entotheonella palauensis]|uniref:TauD/TfdA dioxygenase family protein n=1 Tax=Candidatus Entotheonella palauensis TaxID=93172 RepID=UPI000B7C7ADE|nr:TauD/TfdA family dioxygenase [Candidatus Entotheonella palauensis]
MAVTFKELTETFAAEVYGIDIVAGVDEADAAEVVRLFNTYSVLVFPEQDIDDEQQIRFSQSLSDMGGFGGLEQTVVTNEGAGSKIAVISNVDVATDTIIAPSDKRMVFNSGNEMWHTDSSFKRVPATASLLSGREVPLREGQTEFATQRVAYGDLPAEQQQRLEHLIAIHDFSYSRGLVAPDLINDAQRRETPPVPQAVVRINPANGRKNFYAGAHASHIRGMPVEEGRTLLKELTAIATQQKYVYCHTWRPKDLVMWDNRCCLHRGRPWEKAKYRRVMHRTTIAGVGPTAD